MQASKLWDAFGDAATYFEGREAGYTEQKQQQLTPIADQQKQKKKRCDLLSEEVTGYEERSEEREREREREVSLTAVI